MGIDLRQLIKSLTTTKEFIKEENDKLDKKFAAEIQTMCSLYNGQLSAVSMLDQQVGLQDGPIGTVISYMGTTAPRHYLVCDGATYNIADYPLLADHFKREFGEENHFGGDGTTTFAVPDLRGEFLRGSGESSYTNQGSGSDVGEHQHATEHVGSISGTGNILAPKSVDANIIPNNVDNTIRESTRIYLGPGTVYSSTFKMPEIYTARPSNTSVLYCIKASAAYFCNVEAQANVFDTTKPVIIGVYNGAPIYRRLFNFEFTPTEGDTERTLSSDISRILNMYGTLAGQVAANNYATCPIGYPYVDNKYNVGVYHTKSTNVVHFVLGSGWYNIKCTAELVVEYLAK